MTLDFFGDENEYVRHAVRGQSTLFECLEKKDVVLQAVVPNTSTDTDTDNTTIPVRSLQLSSVQRSASTVLHSMTVCPAKTVSQYDLFIFLSIVHSP